MIKDTGWMDVKSSFVDAQTGWAVACTVTSCICSDAVFAVVKTTDGGQSWEIIEPRLMP
jgi:photosystem II stability/assembly factor-like uncharacterized protein